MKYLGMYVDGKRSPIKAVSSINTENIIFYRTLCNRLSLRINPPIAINNEFYLKMEQH